MPVRNCTQEEYLTKAVARHGNLYDYSKVVYRGSAQKITIICRRCSSEFDQIATNHTRGQGCPKCGGTERLSTNDFVAKSQQVHGDRYDYSRVAYTNNRTKVTISCRVCTETFMQSPDHHMAGHGCPKCGGTKLLSQEEFIQRSREIHDNAYDYSQVVYVNCATPVMIGCIRCQRWFGQVASNHLFGKGCAVCGDNVRATVEDFVEKARRVHGELYNYSQVVYTNNNTKVAITCRKCGCTFLQTPDVHTNNKCGCPVCKNKTEAKLFQWLREKYPNYTILPQQSLPSLPLARYDFYIVELRLFVELDGPQHFLQIMDWQSPEKTREQDVTKMLEAAKYTVSMARVLQEEVNQNRNNWDQRLAMVIDHHAKLLTQNIHCQPQLYFIDTNNEYQDHKTALSQRLH